MDHDQHLFQGAKITYTQENWLAHHHPYSSDLLPIQVQWVFALCCVDYFRGILSERLIRKPAFISHNYCSPYLLTLHFSLVCPSIILVWRHGKIKNFIFRVMVMGMIFFIKAWRVAIQQPGYLCWSAAPQVLDECVVPSSASALLSLLMSSLWPVMWNYHSSVCIVVSSPTLFFLSFIFVMLFGAACMK